MKAIDLGPVPGYRPAYLALVDPALREPLRRVYSQHFHANDDADIDAEIAAGARLAAWVSEPITSAEVARPVGSYDRK